MQVRKKKNEIVEQNEKLADEQYEKLMNFIKGYRFRKNIALADLAVKTQTYPSYIQRVEIGKINTTVKKLIVILDAMGLELNITYKKGIDLENITSDLKNFNKAQ